MKRIYFHYALFVLLFLVTFFDCKGAFCEGDTQVLAKIGEYVITSDQFKLLIQKLPQDQRVKLLVDENSRVKFLDRLIDTRLVYLEALRMGFDKNTDVIKKMELVKEQIVVSKYVEDEINQKISVSREAIEEFYRINRDRFIVSNPIRIRHILVLTESEAKAILERLRKGEDFIILAQNKSIDPSSKRGGDLGWLEKRVMAPNGCTRESMSVMALCRSWLRVEHCDRRLRAAVRRRAAGDVVGVLTLWR